MRHEDLVGQIFFFDYLSESYRIEILSTNKLHWTRVKGENSGVNDEESYVFSTLDERKIMLTWIEADGLGLSNVLDLNAKTLTTHANLGREVFVNSGVLGKTNA